MSLAQVLVASACLEAHALKALSRTTCPCAPPRGRGGADIVVANNALFCEATSAIELPEGRGPAVFAANAVLGQVSG